MHNKRVVPSVDIISNFTLRFYINFRNNLKCSNLQKSRISVIICVEIKFLLFFFFKKLLLFQKTKKMAAQNRDFSRDGNELRRSKSLFSMVGPGTFFMVPNISR